MSGKLPLFPAISAEEFSFAVTKLGKDYNYYNTITIILQKC